jgi:alpha,alpha-trehalase
MSNGWSIVYEDFDPAGEGLREALCTLGNGYFCTRGAAPETEADEFHYPGTYLAGGYNRLNTEMAGRTVQNEDLVNLPNWLCLTFRIGDGNWFRLQGVEVLSYRQELDIRQGVLYRQMRFQDKDARIVRLSERRLVSMANPHLAALETTLTAENWSGLIEIRSALDGRVINAGVERYRSLNSKHLEPLETRIVNEDTIFLKVQTNQSQLRIAQSARTRVFQRGEPQITERHKVEEPGYIADDITLYMEQGSSVAIEKVVSLFTSRDPAISECGHDSRKALTRAGSFDVLLEKHRIAWQLLGRRFNSEGEFAHPEGERVAMIVRLHLFHLLQTVSPHTAELDVGVPARGWHGEAYRGHVFWDELFIFPLLNFRIPEITRALLLYRCRRLDEARAAAQRAGYRGAMYPWQSGSNGREETQTVHLNPRSGRWLPDSSHLQRHVNLAIAYNVWQYFQATLDMEFLSYHGAEMFLEIARFWASIATYNPKLDRFEILGVMGPDEYHEAYPNSDKGGLNNNAYTNIMAVWVLSRALELMDLLSDYRSKEICKAINLTQEELNHWQDITRKMRVCFHNDGIISQFEGYEKLEELDWDAYREKYGDIHRMDRILEAEGDSANNYKLSKQGDVLMLFYLFSPEAIEELLQKLGYEFDASFIPKNIDYYMHRTSHGSTLSRIVHSWVLARSDRARSWKFFTEALESDVSDSQGGTTKEGIHLGAMAGSVDLIQQGYTGIEMHGDALRFDPCLPDEIQQLRMRIRYRDHLLMLVINHEKLKVTSIKPRQKPIKIGVGGEYYELTGGETKEFNLVPAETA